MYATYDELRQELVHLQQEAMRLSRRSSGLYHDLFWAPDLEWTPDEFESFSAANQQENELWVRYSEKWAGGRFYWSGHDREVELFLKSSDRGTRLLKGIGFVAAEATELPVGFRFELATHDWLLVLHEFAARFPTPKLQEIKRWWGEKAGGPAREKNSQGSADFRDHVTTPAEGAPVHTHPMCQSLQQDVFTASAEFIQLLLDPESVVPVNWWDGEVPVCLPPSDVHVSQLDEVPAVSTSAGTTLEEVGYPLPPAAVTSVPSNGGIDRVGGEAGQLGDHQLPEASGIWSSIAASLQRIADHVDPLPPDKVGTPYIAERLGCTTVWITEMVRKGEIPKGCVVPGTGNGKPWKFYRERIDQWLESR